MCVFTCVCVYERERERERRREKGISYKQRGSLHYLVPRYPGPRQHAVSSYGDLPLDGIDDLELREGEERGGEGEEERKREGEGERDGKRERGKEGERVTGVVGGVGESEVIQSEEVFDDLTSEEIRSRAVTLLKRVYGFSEFRDGQLECIEKVMRGRNSLLILPTGGGKSLCYQVPRLQLSLCFRSNSLSFSLSLPPLTL